MWLANSSNVFLFSSTILKYLVISLTDRDFSGPPGISSNELIQLHMYKLNSG